jgi:CubicO group peptidase (beta-lactamase class C family)
VNRAEKAFLKELGDRWQSATPGFCVQAFSKGKKCLDLQLGQTYPFYDFASLTKVVFTTTALMMLFDEKRFKLTDPVQKWVSWFPEKSVAPSSQAKVKNLLTHSAGLNWWYPFYKKLAPLTTPGSDFVGGRRASRAGLSPEEAWSKFEKVLRARIGLDLKKQSPSAELKNTKAVYSDLDFFLLGSSLQEMTGVSLYENWQWVRERLDLPDTDFHRENRPAHARRLYAPTEICSFRKKTLQGEVHDENTWALRGVAPHAGLFGTISDLSHWALQLRKAKIKQTNGAFASHETVELFSRRAVARTRGDWALGFMLPTLGSASCGPLFSKSSFGHTGFTGTSVWLDPEKDLLIVLLSNRVHPTRENREFVQLRPLIHTLIASAITG